MSVLLSLVTTPTVFFLMKCGIIGSRPAEASGRWCGWLYGNMVYHIHMKTTIDLPDRLLIAAKRRAAETRTTLRVLFERSLRRELRRPDRRAGRPRSIKWVTVSGGLPAGVDPADRAAMHDALRRGR